jgi:hypothetical protein
MQLASPSPVKLKRTRVSIGFGVQNAVDSDNKVKIALWNVQDFGSGPSGRWAGGQAPQDGTNLLTLDAEVEELFKTRLKLRTDKQPGVDGEDLESRKALSTLQREVDKELKDSLTGEQELGWTGTHQALSYGLWRSRVQALEQHVDVINADIVVLLEVQLKARRPARKILTVFNLYAYDTWVGEQLINRERQDHDLPGDLVSDFCLLKRGSDMKKVRADAFDQAVGHYERHQAASTMRCLKHLAEDNWQSGALKRVLIPPDGYAELGDRYWVAARKFVRYGCKPEDFVQHRVLLRRIFTELLALAALEIAAEEAVEPPDQHEPDYAAYDSALQTARANCRAGWGQGGQGKDCKERLAEALHEFRSGRQLTGGPPDIAMALDMVLWGDAGFPSKVKEMLQVERMYYTNCTRNAANDPASEDGNKGRGKELHDLLTNYGRESKAKWELGPDTSINGPDDCKKDGETIMVRLKNGWTCKEIRMAFLQADERPAFIIYLSKGLHKLTAIAVHAPAPARVLQRLQWYAELGRLVDEETKGDKHVVLLGDMNTGVAHCDNDSIKGFYAPFFPDLEDHLQLKTSLKMQGENEEMFSEPYDKILVHKNCPLGMCDLLVAHAWDSAERARRYSDHLYISAVLEFPD